MKKNNKWLSTFSSQAIIILLLSTLMFVSIKAETITLKAGHPQQYVVQEGDTLWGIAGHFLNQPWLWPEIWQNNQQIKNPHLIYPGDELRLIYIDGKPYITRDKYGKKTIRLSPETRSEILSKAIPTIPLDVISPYLSKNLILNASEYNQLPYVVGVYNRLSASTYDLIYVQGIAEDTSETLFGIYRRGRAYRNPINNNEVLGYEAVYLGEGTLEKKGSPATIYVNKSKAEILTKHRLIPLHKDRIIDANFTPKASKVTRKGTIIGVLTSGMQPGVAMVGALDVVIIDVGLKDGAETGDVFNISTRGKIIKDPLNPLKAIKLPNEENGNLMIFRAYNRISYAIVLDAYTDFRVGDVIHSPSSTK
jgi:hypothetical protein